ncbi:hypothetical protein BST61_g8181 [Cercospora zeina]
MHGALFVSREVPRACRIASPTKSHLCDAGGSAAVAYKSSTRRLLRISAHVVVNISDALSAMCTRTKKRSSTN